LVHARWVALQGPPGQIPTTPFRGLADGDVRFVGDPIALVVAESRYVAEDACELVEVDIEALDPVLDMEAALALGAPLVHPELGTNVAGAIPPMDDPELDGIFAGAAHVVTETLSQHRY